MSKTAKEVFTEQIVGPSPGWTIDDAEAYAIIEALDAAGFVIVTKSADTDAKHNWPISVSREAITLAARMFENNPNARRTYELMWNAADMPVLNQGRFEDFVLLAFQAMTKAMLELGEIELAVDASASEEPKP